VYLFAVNASNAINQKYYLTLVYFVLLADKD